MNNVYIWLLSVSILSILLGTVLWYIRRGVRSGDGPHCRRCGYPAAGSLGEGCRCPECGAALRSTRDVWPWSRRPVAAWWKLIAVALVAGVLTGVVGLGGAARKVWNDPNPPTWVLVKKAMNGSRQSRLAAAGLLAWRANPLASDPATLEDLRPIIKWALEEQRDTTQPWATELSDVVSQASLGRRIDRDDEERYLKDSISGRVKARETIVQGARLPVQCELVSRPGQRVSYRDTSGASHTPRYAVGELEVESLTIDGVAQALPPHVTKSGWGLVTSMSDTREVGVNVGPGVHDAVLTYRFVAREVVKVTPDGDPSEFGITLHDTRVVHQWKLTVVSKGEPVLKPVRGVAAMEATAACITIPPNGLQYMGQRTSGKPNGIMLSIDLKPLPFPVAARIVLREHLPPGTGVEPREYRPRLMFARPAGASKGTHFGCTIPDFADDIAAFDIIFVPDESAAYGTVDMTEYLAEEIVIEYVPIVPER